MHILWMVLLTVLWCSNAWAQLWSGYLNTARGIDWQSIPYSIPNASWTQCGSTVAAGTSIAAINTQIASCPNNSYVQLGPGTFDVGTSNIVIRRSNVELRGAGPTQTTIQGAGAGGLAPGTCLVCVDNGFEFFGAGGPMRTKSVVNGAIQGSTSIGLSDVSGLSVGQAVLLWQDNEDNSLTYAPMVMCGVPFNGYVCLHWSGNDQSSGTLQLVRITNISGTTVNFTPGLYYSRWSNSLHPTLAYVAHPFIQNVGVSNLTIANTAAPTGSNSSISLYTVDGGWVNNVRFNGCDNTCSIIQASRKVNFFNNYLFQSYVTSQPSGLYGLAIAQSSDITVYNNICQQIQACFLGDGGGQGIIIAYNFIINDEYFDSGNGSNWLNAAIFTNHADGMAYTLSEGNDGAQLNIDWAHGTGCCHVMLRNFFPGQGWSRNTLTTNDTVAAYVTAYTRFNSFFGNVLGTVGVQQAYQSVPGSPFNPFDKVIYNIGFCGGGNPTNCGSQQAADTIALTSLMRWGNYDTVTGGVRWNANEVPSDLSVPTSQSVPASFWLVGKPAWFGNVPWPPIGPDVTGGNISGYGGHINKIPARVCYETVMGGPADGQGAILTFDANRCYGAGSNSTPPAAPTVLRVS